MAEKLLQDLKKINKIMQDVTGWLVCFFSDDFFKIVDWMNKLSRKIANGRFIKFGCQINYPTLMSKFDEALWCVW